jgi:hypothetical protein
LDDIPGSNLSLTRFQAPVRHETSATSRTRTRFRLADVKNARSQTLSIVSWIMTQPKRPWRCRRSGRVLSVHHRKSAIGPTSSCAKTKPTAFQSRLSLGEQRSLLTSRELSHLAFQGSLRLWQRRRHICCQLGPASGRGSRPLGSWRGILRSGSGVDRLSPSC